MNNNHNTSTNKSASNKKPRGPKLISRSKYFKIGIRDSARVRIIKEGMNHLFNVRNNELEEAYLQEATQYTERILGETRHFHFTEEEDQEIMNTIFGGVNQEEPGLEEGAELEVEEIIDGQEEERREAEAEQELEESETLGSEEVLALQERIQAEDQEEYDRIRAELEEEEEDEANKDN